MVVITSVQDYARAKRYVAPMARRLAFAASLFVALSASADSLAPKIDAYIRPSWRATTSRE